MKVVVIGTGKVGRSIVEHTRQEGHEVILIDKNRDLIEDIIDELDVMGVVGNGASYDILKEAGVDKADLVVAATSSDETNILSCLIARKIGAKATVARVRSYEYDNQFQIIRDGLGITMPINPEKETANEIAKILNFPEALRVDSFANGNVDLVELFIPEGNPLIGQSLLSIYQTYQIKVLVCAVIRGDEVIIPTGCFVFQPKDKIYITANSSETLRTFLSKSGLQESKLKSVMIVGG
jgi:trk system potassium uptake protein TrkA